MNIFSKIFKAILQHKFITGIILLLVIVGGYFGYRFLFSSKNTLSYVTAAAEKGDLIVSVSGSGQVSNFNQTDIKPKASGDIVWLGIKDGQEVSQGQVILKLDDTDIKKEIADAEWNLDREKQNYDNILTDAERSLAIAYEDGYSSVSTTFFKLADYMKDLKDVLGTENKPKEYISGYKLILGSDSLFIQKVLDDYDGSFDLFKKKFAVFRGIYKNAGRDTIYQLIGDTLELTKTVSQALESSRHMYDAIAVENYSYLVDVSSQIDKMTSKIKSDVTSVYSDISSLQKIKDTIDDTNKNTPENIIVAKKNLQDKEDTLKKLGEDLSDYAIKASFAGVISDVKVEKGDSISSATTIATLITKQKIAEITLNEVDVANVKQGQKVNLTFDAINGLNITGKVAEVDTVGTVSQGVVNYNVKIALDTQDDRIKPGMSVSAAIIIEIRQNVILAQNSAIKYQNNAGYVEVMGSDGSINSKQVEIGASNDTLTEIISGLQEGEKVITQTISQTSNSSLINGSGNQNSSRNQGEMMRMIR